MSLFQESILELITETSTNLPPDVRRAMADGLQSETPATQASQALNVIATNIDMATQDEGPICQDTGMPTFKIRTPVGANQLALREAPARTPLSRPPGGASSAPTRWIR